MAEVAVTHRPWRRALRFTAPNNVNLLIVPLARRLRHRHIRLATAGDFDLAVFILPRGIVVPLVSLGGATRHVCVASWLCRSLYRKATNWFLRPAGERRCGLVYETLVGGESEKKGQVMREQKKNQQPGKKSWKSYNREFKKVAVGETLEESG
jgi:hypothetical protein